MKKYLVATALAAVGFGSYAEGYVGVSFGKGKTSYSCNENLDCKRAGSLFKAYAGTRLNDGDKFDLAGIAVVDAMEVLYIKTSKVSSLGFVNLPYYNPDPDVNDVVAKDFSVKYRIGMDALVFAPVFRVKIDSDVSVFSRLGLAIVSATLSKDLDGQTNKSDTATKFKPYFALGADYRVVDSLKVVGSFDVLPYEVNGVKGTVRSVGLGAEYSY
jgi:hypothetical protein